MKVEARQLSVVRRVSMVRACGGLGKRVSNPVRGPESGQGATGWPKGGVEPIPQPHGGALTPFQPGSNGGVHRGPGVRTVPRDRRVPQANRGRACPTRHRLARPSGHFTASPARRFSMAQTSALGPGPTLEPWRRLEGYATKLGAWAWWLRCREGGSHEEDPQSGARVVMLSLALAAPVSAWSGRGGGFHGGFRGGFHHDGFHHFCCFGPAFVGGVFVGSALAYPYYAYPYAAYPVYPDPVYAPAPAYQPQTQVSVAPVCYASGCYRLQGDGVTVAYLGMGAGCAGGAPGSAKPLRAHSASLLLSPQIVSAAR